MPTPMKTHERGKGGCRAFQCRDRGYRSLHGQGPFQASHPWGGLLSTLGMKHAVALIHCALGLCFCVQGHSVELLDDRAITVHSSFDISQRRQKLIEYLWGAEGFTSRVPDKVITNVACPVKPLADLRRVDE